MEQNSHGFTNTIVNLPASAAGQTIQLRWLCGADSSVTSSGWYIDSIAISNLTCCSGSVADLVLGDSISAAAVNVSSNVTFTLNVTNLGPNSADSVSVADTLPAGLTFTTASVSQGTWSNNGNSFSASLGTIANQSSATVTIQALANSAGQWTNYASVLANESDSNLGNNTASVAELVNSPPTISGLSDVTMAENAVAGPIGFTIGDAETAASSLILTASSSNPSLIDSTGIVFGGADVNPTVTLTPFAGQSGVATITLTVSDGMATANTSFTLTVSQPNQGAVLPSIPDVVMFEKSLLTFTNKAVDPEQPAQTLTYSLSNAPAGAFIDANSGIFTWTPTEAQGPSTNRVTVVVTDNGSPPMSTSQSFDVVVLESNEPPVLAPIPDRTIHAGMTFAITNSATDPDLPTNTLTFSLDSAVAGADINPTNGVFVWTPDSSFVNTTNTFTVTVTDDNPWAANTQHLSDAKSFTVLVVPPPAFSSGVVSNGIMTLTWSSISGQTYRVQYSTNLADTNWQDLTPDVMATGDTASQTDSPLSDTQEILFAGAGVLP